MQQLQASVGHLKGYKNLTLQPAENPDVPVYVPNEDDNEKKQLENFLNFKFKQLNLTFIDYFSPCKTKNK